MPKKNTNSVMIKGWQVIDIYYNEDDIEQVEKLIEQFKLKGYSDEQWDNSGTTEFDGCVQMTKLNNPRKVNLNKIL